MHMPRVRLYIDVDGVLLKPVFGDARIPLQRMAEDVAEFLEWAVKHFDCHWLTAWAINGDGRHLKVRLIPKLPAAARLSAIPPVEPFSPRETVASLG